MRTLTWTWLALACAALSLTPGLAQEGEDPGSAPSGGGETGEVSPAEGDEGTSEEALGEEDAEETGDVDTVEDELVEEDPGPDPTDIVFWEAHQTYEGALLAGLMYQDTHGPFSWFTREVGTPPEGGVLRAADYNWYMGGGRLLDVYAITPFETDQAGGVSFRQYGLGDFRAGWTTFEYNSFPIETHSQWKASDYRLRYLGSDLIGVNLGRQHLAHYGVREFGQIQGETTVLSGFVPFQTVDKKLQGRASVAGIDYQDHSGRWRDIDTTRAGGSLQYALGEGRYISGAAAWSSASLADSDATQTTQHYTLAYNDLNVGGAEGLGWEVRGDWEGGGDSIERSWVQDDEWTLGTRLTWDQKPWKVWAGFSTGARNRYRLSAQAIQELLLDPDRTAFDRGVYIAASPTQNVFDVGARWRPTRDWNISASWKHTTQSDLPPTSLGEGEEGSPETLLDPTAPLFFAVQDRIEATARYTFDPGRLAVLNGTIVERELDERNSSTAFTRWDLTYHDARRPLAWYGRLGWYSNSASRDRVDLFANRAILYGVGFSHPFMENRLRLSGDATFGDGASRGAYDEWIGSLALEYLWREDLSLILSYVGQAIDMEETEHYDAESHRLGVYVKWEM